MSVHGIQLHNCQFQPRYDAPWISLEPLLLGRHCQRVAFNWLCNARSRSFSRAELVMTRVMRTSKFRLIPFNAPPAPRSPNSPWISGLRRCRVHALPSTVSELVSPASVTSLPCRFASIYLFSADSRNSWPPRGHNQQKRREGGGIASDRNEAIDARSKNRPRCDTVLIPLLQIPRLIIAKLTSRERNLCSFRAAKIT